MDRLKLRHELALELIRQGRPSEELEPWWDAIVGAPPRLESDEIGGGGAQNAGRVSFYLSEDVLLRMENGEVHGDLARLPNLAEKLVRLLGQTPGVAYGIAEIAKGIGCQISSVYPTISVARKMIYPIAKGCPDAILTEKRHGSSAAYLWNPEIELGIQ